MIREEIEKLRGYVFTEEELNEVIRPAVIATEWHYSDLSKEDWALVTARMLKEQFVAFNKQFNISIPTGICPKGFLDVMEILERISFELGFNLINYKVDLVEQSNWNYRVELTKIVLL